MACIDSIEILYIQTQYKNELKSIQIFMLCYVHGQLNNINDITKSICDNY